MQGRAEAKPAAAAVPFAAPQLKLPENTSISAKKAVETAPATAEAAPAGDAPVDGEVAEGPKLQVKADGAVEVEGRSADPAVVSAPEKRDVPALVPRRISWQTSSDATIAAAVTTAAGAQANVHGEVRAVHSAYQSPRRSTCRTWRSRSRGRSSRA